MVCVRTHAAAGDFAVNLGATCQSVFHFFKYQYHRTFSDDEAVTRSREGARSRFGAVVACRQGMHRVETAHASGEDGSLGTACNHSISLAQTDKVESVDNGVV